MTETLSLNLGSAEFLPARVNVPCENYFSFIELISITIIVYIITAFKKGY